MLNKRQENIITIVSEQDKWLTGKELSVMLQVSDRTIRSDIDSINKFQNCSLIESSSRLGYRINNELKNVTVKDVSSPIPQTPNERGIYILRKLLFNIKELNLTLLQEQVCISGYSIDNDIKRIRKMIKPYPGLDLIRSKEYLSLQGDEESKRKLYKDLLSAEIQENFLNLNQIACLYNNFDLIQINDIFLKVLDEYQYSINESMFPMLILHIGIGIDRIMHYNYIQACENGEFLGETIEYQISKTFFERITPKLNISIVEEEVKLFALLLMGKKSSNYTSDFTRFDGQWINVEKLVGKMLCNIHELFGINFGNDSDLVLGLKMHIHGLIERKKNKIQIENIFLQEIKRKYPLVFDMGVYAAKFLEAQLNVTIGETESGFIALHLGAASERMNANRKYRAVIILPYNQSFSSLCESKIRSTFHERMEILETFNFFEKDKILKISPDLILTTFPLSHELDILTLRISLFINSETEAAILQALNRLDKNRFHVEFTSQIGKLIREVYYYQDFEGDNPQDIIRYMCDQMEQGGIVSSEFKAAVLKREEMSPTSFVQAIAIPHAFGTFAKESTISVAQLSTPVKWGCYHVRLIMLLAINESDHAVVKMFFDWISDAMNNPNCFCALCESNSYLNFLEIITS